MHSERNDPCSMAHFAPAVSMSWIYVSYTKLEEQTYRRRINVSKLGLADARIANKVRQGHVRPRFLTCRIHIVVFTHPVSSSMCRTIPGSEASRARVDCAHAALLLALFM